MDKVQFNTEVVNMRKVIKRTKVLVVHSLTRQVTKLRRKKGSEQQVLKNQRRATRYVAEIESLKDLPADTITQKAVVCNRSLQDVLNNPKFTAKDRVLARVIHHQLIQERVIRFKGLVTKDLLRTGTKKYRRLRLEKLKTQTETKLREEEDYQDTLEKMMTTQDDAVEVEDRYNDDGSDVSDVIDDSDSDTSNDSYDSDSDLDEAAEDEIQKKSDPMRTSRFLDEISYQRNSEDESEDSDAENQDNGNFFKKFGKNSAKYHEEELNISDESETNQTMDNVARTMESRTGKKQLDSMLVGSLSSMKDEDVTDVLLADKKGFAEKKTENMQIRKQDDTEPKPNRGKDTKAKTPYKVPMVDQPNAVKQTHEEKLIPGINCHPDLPPRHSWKGSQQKSFPNRPQSKQLPGRQPRQKSTSNPTVDPKKQLHNRAAKEIKSNPTADTKSTSQTAAAKEHLHPSWEASKKRAKASRIVQFQGKKITFDDD